MKKICKKHGLTKFYLEASGTRKRCSKCRNELTTKRRQAQKRKLVELKGGCCEICGYNKCITALHFHHNDPKTKEFGISKSKGTKSLAELIKEVKKCKLVCANCHAELHDKE